MCWWLRLDERASDGISFRFDSASLTDLGVNEWEERTIVRLNDTRHLPDGP